MARIIMMFIRNLFLLPYAFVRLIRHSRHPENYTEEQHFELFRFIVQMANNGGNVAVETTGSELLPEKDGFVFYPNHQGMYDALALIAACNRTFRVIAKKETKNIPLLSLIYRSNQSLFIDREDVRQSLTIINDAANMVKEGYNILIFAEGTRSRKGNQINEFKGGSFKLAMKAKCPIVPVALLNSFVPFDSKSLKQVTVQVHFLEPIYYETYKSMKTNEIAEMVQSRIAECIREHEKQM